MCAAAGRTGAVVIRTMYAAARRTMGVAAGRTDCLVVVILRTAGAVCPVVMTGRTVVRRTVHAAGTAGRTLTVVPAGGAVDTARRMADAAGRMTYAATGTAVTAAGRMASNMCDIAGWTAGMAAAVAV